MKKQILLLPILMLVFMFTSCTDDSDPVNEEEVITTMTVTLTPDNGGTNVVLETRDLDGDTGEDPVVTVTGGPLTSGTIYSGSIVLLNETEDPAENVTEEIEEEDDEHQFFFVVGSGLDVTTSYNDEDDNGNPVGLSFTLTAGSASSGDFTVTLRHAPTKPNTGINDAGGETDIEETFPIIVQ
tara:strand:- start:191 stop:739 length:549 start_codon:yes stop_codon:yes gene_type:complete